LIAVFIFEYFIGEMKQWHHPKCLFEMFEKARATTKIIESTDEIEGFTDLTDEDKDMIKDLLKGLLLEVLHILYPRVMSLIGC